MKLHGATLKYKTCTKCGYEKPITEFYELKFNRVIKGKKRKPEWYGPRYNSQCKSCVREYNKNRRRLIREKYPHITRRRHKEYKRKAIKDGSMARAGIAYILNAPIDNLRWCNRCKKYLLINNFRKIKNKRSRFDTIDYHDTICRLCHQTKHKEKYVPSPRKPRTDEEIKKHNRDYMRIYNYLLGDGCCLYCWETNPFMLNNHHPWKKVDPNFTVTLCENHHAPFTRGIPFVLERWNIPKEKSKNNS